MRDSDHAISSRVRGVFALPRFYPTAIEGAEPREWTKLVDVACGLVCFAALMSLVGWWRGIPILTTFVPGYPTMKVNTAISLLCLGISLWAKRRERPGWILAVLGDGLAAAALVVAGLTLLEYAVDRPFGIDNWLLLRFGAPVGYVPGRMSEGTSLNLTMLAVALLLMDRMSKTSRLLLVLSMLVSVSALVGYMYVAQPQFGVRVLKSIAIQTALALLLLQIACFAARPDREPVASLFSPELGAVGRLELLIGTWAMQLLMGLAVTIGLKRGWYEIPFGIGLFAVLMAALQTLLIWKSSYTLTRLARNKQRMEEVLRRNEKLAVAGRLAASISHEINNPLEAISNLLYLIQTSDDVVEGKRYAEIAGEELRRVSQITTQTLSFYRENTLPKVCDVLPIVESAVQLLQGKISSQGVELLEEYGDLTGQMVCSAGELRQVLVNLISNALDATQRGGKIVLRAREGRLWNRDGGRSVRIWVSDSGSGMSDPVRRRIFEPFYTTKEKTGNGLGLWVAADLVQKHGGWLRVRSRPDGEWRGTTFLLVLPYPQADPKVENEVTMAERASV